MWGTSDTGAIIIIPLITSTPRRHATAASIRNAFDIFIYTHRCYIYTYKKSWERRRRKRRTFRQNIVMSNQRCRRLPQNIKHSREKLKHSLKDTLFNKPLFNTNIFLTLYRDVYLFLTLLPNHMCVFVHIVYLNKLDNVYSLIFETSLFKDQCYFHSFVFYFHLSG